MSGFILAGKILDGEKLSRGILVTFADRNFEISHFSPTKILVNSLSHNQVLSALLQIFIQLDSATEVGWVSESVL